MPLIAVSVILQIFCGVHVLKTGRNTTWLWLIILLPPIGCIIYIVMEIIPDLKHSWTFKRFTRNISKKINPQRDLKQHANKLSVSDNLKNKINLAHECIENNLAEKAIEMLEQELDGFYQEDPELLHVLALAYFTNQNYKPAKQTLDNLKIANPDYKSPAAHLLYARTLENMKLYVEAEHEYQVLANYYPGPEAKYRYAELLIKLDKTTEAHAHLKEIITDAKYAPKHYQKTHKYWIKWAKEKLNKGISE